MSNGRHAIKGFEYQATVNLQLILNHFKNSAEDVLICPEDEDDLVIINTHDQSKHYYQIKKPREFDNGALKNDEWSLNSVIDELLPGTFARLTGNKHQQTWILGDKITADAKMLLSAGIKAPADLTVQYMTAIHFLARERSNLVPKEKSIKRNKLISWKPSASMTVSTMITEFCNLAMAEGITTVTCNKYKDISMNVDLSLPDVLKRVHVLTTYGTDDEIRNSIQQILKEDYDLEWEIIKDTLIPGLRNYIYNISSQIGKTITKADFEKEIKIVWPRMTMVCNPPAIDKTTLNRLSLVQDIINRAHLGSLEITGISGSGKTTLAGELIEYIKEQKTDTHSFYVEVQSNKSFRDVIVGVSFHLRKIGINDFFPRAVNYSSSDEKSLIEIAEMFSSSKVKLMVIIDLVHGICSDEFSKEIAKFLEKLKSDSVSFIVMGQESSFRYLSLFQRDVLKLPSPMNIPGFTFEEFISLFKIIHTEIPNRPDLWSIYNKLTANRQSGLYAKLANSITSCRTIKEMNELAKNPEKILQEADRNRYNQIEKDLRNVIDKLLCFFLPFNEEEASGLYPADRIKEAIKEAVDHGLLRPLDNHRFEFHETVRNGLIQFIPSTVYISNNELFADHYMQREQFIAAIYHMEESGQIEKAHRIARSSFLEGKHRGNLKSYITKHGLIKSSEIIQLLKNENQSEIYYMLPDMLKNIGNGNDAIELLKVARDESERFDKDYQWAWRIVEAILICDSEKLYELVQFGLEKTITETDNDRLQFIIHGVRRPGGPIIDNRLLHLFENKQNPIKIRLLPLLLMDKRREVLKSAFLFLNSYDESDDQQGKKTPNIFKNIQLKLETTEELREFLSSLPMPDDTSQMVIHKSVMLGRMENYIWSERHILQPQCKEILKNQAEEETIILNALRVLTFYQDENAFHFAEQNTRVDKRITTFTAFIPIFFPQLTKPEKYHLQVLDNQLPMEKRIMAFSILSNIGYNIDPFVKELTGEDEPSANAWKFFIVTNSILNPCKNAIPLFEEMLNDTDVEKTLDILAPVIHKFGELPGEEVTGFLIRMLKTPWPQTRLFACLSLSRRRSRSALPALIELCQNEKDLQLAQMALVAAIASGPDDINSFADIWPRCADTEKWRCILSGRLKAVSEADQLIKTAIDQSKHWQIRRAAILAAGSLPFNIAMKKIYQPVMEEKSPFSLDKSNSLIMHNIMTTLMIEHGNAFLHFFIEGKESFVKFWGDIFQSWTQDTFYPITNEDGNIYAEWLFKRMKFHGSPSNLKALDIILNELHKPILQAAVLHGLRLTSRSNLIEKFITKADTEWLLLRILCEWFKETKRTEEDIQRIRKLLSKSSFSNSISAKNIINNMSNKNEIKSSKTSEYIDNSPHPIFLNYDDILKALETGKLPEETPIKLIDLSEEQFRKLIIELDPERDHETSIIITDPKLTYSESGPSIIGNIHKSTERNKHIREKLRPTLSVANKFGINIPWHPKLLAGIQSSVQFDSISKKYTNDFISSIAASGDYELLYAELEKNADPIMDKLGMSLYKQEIKKMINNKIIPYLRTYANAGTDNILESLCALALCIENDSIDAILNELFSRWCNRFKRSEKEKQHYRNTPLWKAFNNLRKHPRFKNIPDYDRRLLEILHCNLYWINRDDVINSVKDSPQCYIDIEQMLLKAVPFEHRGWDEVDRFEEIVQNLFGETVG